jgi:hypothetical protein
MAPRVMKKPAAVESGGAQEAKETAPEPAETKAMKKPAAADAEPPTPSHPPQKLRFAKKAAAVSEPPTPSPRPQKLKVPKSPKAMKKVIAAQKKNDTALPPAKRVPGQSKDEDATPKKAARPLKQMKEKSKAARKTPMEASSAAADAKTKELKEPRAEKRKAKMGKTGKKQKDPNAPKKPAGGGYGCFLAANREALQKECPGSVTGVAKLGGKRWKALPASEKEKFNEEYATKKAAYLEQMESYVPTGAFAGSIGAFAAGTAKKRKARDPLTTPKKRQVVDKEEGPEKRMSAKKLELRKEVLGATTVRERDLAVAKAAIAMGRIKPTWSQKSVPKTSKVSQASKAEQSPAELINTDA